MPRRLVVAGHGMVGHRLVTELLDTAPPGAWDVTVIGEEPHAAYDRVNLSTAFSGAGAADLSLVEEGWSEGAGVSLRTGERVVAVDRTARTVRTCRGATVGYDHLVLATGSLPFIPPVPGRDRPGVFAYRTLEDVERIRSWSTGGARVGIVIGGGLLGLEAANALRLLGLEVHVVELAPRLVPAQLDDGGAAALLARIEALGITVHLGAASEEIEGLGADGPVTGLRLADGSVIAADVLVFSAGIRPRDDLARSCGLAVHERGGILVDGGCATSDPTISAVGECAVAAGKVWGLVAPGYRMAAVVADRLGGGDATFEGMELTTKLKLLGVDVASLGDVHGAGPALADPVAATYAKLVLAPDGSLRGAVLVGDVSAYGTLATLLASGALVDDPIGIVAGRPAAGAIERAASPSDLVCTCVSVTRGDLVAAIGTDAITDLAGLKACTRAGTGCGGCTPDLSVILGTQLAAAGIAVRRGLCEHFPDHTRQDLFDLCRVQRISSFRALHERHGEGRRGCDVCRPTVASILASLDNAYILDGERAGLQDTNDWALANLQRDGTYSVVPRMPAGEVTAPQLLACAEVAERYGLYVKVTGGQRLDLFGAQLEDLPAIWAHLRAAGLESGHAYGKSLRTVKSCVGLAWCRYGQLDSTAMARRLELRYRGLRAPHKIKMAVSGCARECAEAQSKDVGVIATEDGWTLYVGGNGGLRPRHADLLAEGLDDDALVRTIDRFLQYYVRTGERLERTAAWVERIDGGLAHVKRVVLDDALGVCGELEAAMVAHVDTYECEWAATLDRPERLALFRATVDA